MSIEIKDKPSIDRLKLLRSTGELPEHVNDNCLEQIVQGVSNGLNENNRVIGAEFIEVSPEPFAVGGESAVYRARIHLKNMKDEDLKRILDDIGTQERCEDPKNLRSRDNEPYTIDEIRRQAKRSEVVKYARILRDDGSYQYTTEEAIQRLKDRKVLEQLVHERIAQRFNASTKQPKDSTVYDSVVKISLDRVDKMDVANRGKRGVKLFRGIMRDDFAANIYGDIVEGRVIIAEEYVRKVDPFKLPLEWRIRLVGQIAGALQYMHDREFIHRDIKVANMLVVEYNLEEAVALVENKADLTAKQKKKLISEFQKIAVPSGDGRMKLYQARLTDMGMVATINPVTFEQNGISLSKSTDIVGTLTYMAPEQLTYQKKKEEKDSVKSDVYQVGGLLYELVTGRRPLPVEKGADFIQMITLINRSDTSKDKAAQIRQNPLQVDELTYLGRKKRKILHNIVPVIECALQFHKAGRYASAQEMEYDIFERVLKRKEPTECNRYKPRMNPAFSERDCCPSQKKVMLLGTSDEHEIKRLRGWYNRVTSNIGETKRKIKEHLLGQTVSKARNIFGFAALASFIGTGAGAYYLKDYPKTKLQEEYPQLVPYQLMVKDYAARWEKILKNPENTAEEIKETLNGH